MTVLALAAIDSRRTFQGALTLVRARCGQKLPAIDTGS